MWLVNVYHVNLLIYGSETAMLKVSLQNLKGIVRNICLVLSDAPSDQPNCHFTQEKCRCFPAPSAHIAI